MFGFKFQYDNTLRNSFSALIPTADKFKFQYDNTLSVHMSGVSKHSESNLNSNMIIL